MNKKMTNHLATTGKLVLCLGLGLTMAACSKSRMTRGYVFDKGLADAIQPGVDNRQSVESTLGSPTVAATFSDNTWYYISTKVRVRPVFWPDPEEHRVMAIAFNDKGTVTSVNNYDLSDMKSVDPVDDKTPTLGRDLGFFQQIFGNVGRFSGAAPVGAGDGRGPNG